MLQSSKIDEGIQSSGQGVQEVGQDVQGGVHTRRNDTSELVKALETDRILLNAYNRRQRSTRRGHNLILDSDLISRPSRASVRSGRSMYSRRTARGSSRRSSKYTGPIGPLLSSRRSLAVALTELEKCKATVARLRRSPTPKQTSLRLQAAAKNVYRKSWVRLNQGQKDYLQALLKK